MKILLLLLFTSLLVYLSYGMYVEKTTTTTEKDNSVIIKKNDRVEDITISAPIMWLFKIGYAMISHAIQQN